MQVKICRDYEEVSRAAADIFEKELKKKPNCVLGLATGTTPLGLYKNLIKAYKKEKVSFKDVTVFNLDEYVGLEKAHPQSYAYFMRKNLFDFIDINLERTFIPDGSAENLEAACGEYSDLLSKNPRDLQLLGIGGNGHIAFNEPFSPFDGKTRLVTLTEKTINDNARLFNSENEVPKRALTMGISEIFAAKKIVLLACGKEKAPAVYNSTVLPVLPDCPASVLQRHKDCIFILDELAASML